MNEINDYLSKADEEIAKNVMYRVYGMPGPLFVENEVTPTPGPEPEPSFNNPFYVENITQENETLTITGFDWSSEQDNYLQIQVEYSTDGTTWETMGTTGATPLTRTLQPSEKVYLRATTNTWYEYQEGTEEQDKVDHGCAIFGVSKVGGNIMSLLYGSSFTGNETTFPTGSRMNFTGLLIDITDEDEYNRNLVSASELILPATTLTPGCYSGMFNGCESLTTAPELPATTLTPGCYSNMFIGCTSLTTAPELPATTLAESCYNNMFNGCESLTTAPELPATTLAESCYNSMFCGCTSLTTAPELPATTLAESCYSNMFIGCTSLTITPELPATTLIPGCYAGMFMRCESLTMAPELPATTLAESCYNNMFIGCTSLTTAPELPATTLAESCYSNMFIGCTSLTITPELPATTLIPGCYAGMFMRCESLTMAPELPATTLAEECYNSMFNGCTSLNEITIYANDIPVEGCLNSWLYDVASNGQFHNLGTATFSGNSSSGCPSGWVADQPEYIIPPINLE